jgi:superfamily I DNA and RNA helicase
MDETWWVDPDDLDDDQKAIAALPLTGSHLITGPPGCGKTNLLLLRAKYYAMSRKENILVLVFTRALRDFIISGSQQYHLPSEIVRTSIGWGDGFLRQHGERQEREEEFNDRRNQLLRDVQELVKRKSLQNIYEAIFLDEAQDYLPEEIELFRRLGREVYASADHRQKIYDGPDSLGLLKESVNRVHPLRYHYRLGHKICRVADSIFVGEEDEPLFDKALYNEKLRPSSVDPYMRCHDLQEQALEIIKKLKVQLDAYPNELLGVMCPLQKQRDELYELIARSDIGDLAVNQSDEPVFERDKPIYVSTLHSSKGLEYRATHLAFAESIRRLSHAKNLTYTAVTRTKTALTVYGMGHPPGYLLQAINSVQPAASPPSLSDLFSDGG